MLEMPELCDICQEELHPESGTHRREMYVAVGKAGREKPSNPFNTVFGAIEFGIFPAGFPSYFGLVFPHYASTTPFWNGNIYSTPLYTRNIAIVY